MSGGQIEALKHAHSESKKLLTERKELRRTNNELRAKARGQLREGLSLSVMPQMRRATKAGWREASRPQTGMSVRSATTVGTREQSVDGEGGVDGEWTQPLGMSRTFGEKRPLTSLSSLSNGRHATCNMALASDTTWYLGHG